MTISLQISATLLTTGQTRMSDGDLTFSRLVDNCQIRVSDTGFGD